MVESDPLIGTTLDGKYRIEALLGKGSMGAVYRARHLTLDSWRAIKVMRPELAQDAASVERFQREARLLEELRHPHLVALYDFAQLPDGAWYIVSEFVEGETLAARLGRTPTLDTADAVRLFQQLADGIAAAHAKGIVHRDLSPDNIMISGVAPDLTAKVLDFGLAKSLLREASAATGYSLVVGKIGYAAPEQMGLVGSAQEIDARADVFSLAAVLYRTLFGRLPWRADSLQSYVHDLLIRPNDSYVQAISQDVPTPWRTVFLEGLARERSRRTRTMEDLRDAIAQAGETAARDATMALRYRSWPPHLLAAALFGGALAVGWIVFAALDAHRPATPPRSTPERTVTPFHFVATALTAREATEDALARPTSATTPSLASRVAHVPLSPGPAVAREAVPPLTPAPTAGATAPATRSPAASTLPGTLVVRSSPEASVRIDGQARGHTPLTLSLPSGVHALSLTTTDGERYEEDVDLAPDSTVQRDHRFPGFGSLAVTSRPWLEVSVDGGAFEQTDFSLARIAAGRHTLRGRRPGYKPVTMDIEVVAGETRSVRLTPERE
jgi:serine/threonine protein kinase